jgi:hypothetical protein
MKDIGFVKHGKASSQPCKTLCFFQHCFNCRPSDSTVWMDDGIKPRPVVILALAVRHFNHSARSHPRHLQTIPLVTSIFTDKKLNIRWKYPSYNPTYSTSRLLSLTQLAVQEPVLWIRKYFFARSVIPDYVSGSGRPINYGSGSVLDIFVNIEKICIRQYYKKLFLIYRFGPRRPFNYGSTAPDPDPQHCIENSATNASRTLEPFNHSWW